MIAACCCRGWIDSSRHAGQSRQGRRIEQCDVGQSSAGRLTVMLAY